MRKPSDEFLGKRNSLIITEIPEVSESCDDCEVANKRRENATQLQQITEFIFDIASSEKTAREVSEIFDQDEGLASTFKKLLDEFLPGESVMRNKNKTNLRIINDLSEDTVEWLIEFANRKIKQYERLLNNCANQALRKILLERAGDKNDVELSFCSGELESAGVSTITANVTELDDNPAA